MDEKSLLPMYGTTCGPKVPTREEEEILAQMMRLKQEVRALKQEISSVKDPTKKEELRARLDNLRAQWSELEQKKEEARIRRMRLLGYED
jgi:predicted RNase H-like nuclease (RuvC/YqgF family)